MIILRTTRMSERTARFARQLEQASGLPVVPLIDARYDDGASGAHIRLDRAAVKALGLFAPRNFAWKCGDYGLYLARRQFDAPFYWLIEYDVRFPAEGLDVFFRDHAAEPADALLTHLGPATPDWYWTVFGAARDVAPVRCLFPISRFSGAAIDLLFAKRVKHSRQLSRRLAWPNDEVFVATTLSASSLTLRDFNRDGRTYYDSESLSFYMPIEGERFERELASRAPFRIFHPVLYDADYRAKIAKLESYSERRKPLRRLKLAVAAAINNRRRW
ncbi:hypothetical protein [Sphingobium chlorophenolicum]|uniref:Uncharacterized protein n=1 Tax=Sphingobium chlorophenolicum TaxID=46429 RepID=A0A081R895_SPHCR|nr:hypothetical protein [Sphingobium chlorophenolicum]KEQ51418.1 hypothetical protein BV95_04320 [Sphingobium chlorophenolicum]